MQIVRFVSCYCQDSAYLVPLRRQYHFGVLSKATVFGSNYDTDGEGQLRFCGHDLIETHGFPSRASS